MTFKIFVGFEPSTALSYWVLRASIKSYWPEAEVVPIVQTGCRLRLEYSRPPDPLASTEFTYTRFLTPYLAGYEGWALFMDSDMLVRGDLRELLTVTTEPGVALACVQHDHQPVETRKMRQGTHAAAQTQYPRKNWSSLILFNCEHLACRSLTPEVVSTAVPSYLHQFGWVDDDDVKSLPTKFNWLEGWNNLEDDPDPLVVHFTRGIPGIHDGCADLPFADEYLALVGERPELIDTF